MGALEAPTKARYSQVGRNAAATQRIQRGTNRPSGNRQKKTKKETKLTNPTTPPAQYHHRDAFIKKTRRSTFSAAPSITSAIEASKDNRAVDLFQKSSAPTAQ